VHHQGIRPDAHKELARQAWLLHDQHGGSDEIESRSLRRYVNLFPSLLIHPCFPPRQYGRGLRLLPKRVDPPENLFFCLG